MRFPLGGDLYAYVNTRRRDGTKIHIRHFRLSTDTKGGIKPTFKGVKMDAKTLRRLFAVKKQLTDEFKLQSAKINEFHEKKNKLQTTNYKMSEQQKQKLKQKSKSYLKLQLQEAAALDKTSTSLVQEIRQQRTNDYPAAFVDLGALTPPQTTCEQQKQKLKQKSKSYLKLQLPEATALDKTSPMQGILQKTTSPEHESRQHHTSLVQEITGPVQEIRQQRTNDYPAAFMDLGALTPNYSYTT